MKKIKPLVFLPPFLLLLAVIVLNFIDKARFTANMTNAKDWVLGTFGEVFAVTPLLMLLTCVVIYFCPFGRVIIGGVCDGHGPSALDVHPLRYLHHHRIDVRLRLLQHEEARTLAGRLASVEARLNEDDVTWREGKDCWWESYIQDV
jgi:hypothetical protein